MLHQSACRRSIDPAHWNKTNLMRLRKNQLEDLAREHELSTGGTKLEIVQRLLQQSSSNTASWEMDDPIERRVQDVIATQRSQAEKSEPGSRPTFEDSMEASSDVIDEEQEHKKKNVTNQEMEAGNWVEAFELKLGHSHLRQKPKRPNMFSAPANTRASSAISQATATAAPLHPTPPSPASSSVDYNEPMPEDINQQWVRAFEQKATSIRSRRHMLGNDTFEPTDIEPNVFDFIDTKDTEKQRQEKPLNDQVEQEIVDSLKSDSSTTTTTTNATADNEKKEDPANSNVVITSMIGSGLLVWVAGGEKGFKHLADILMSSS
ncbi:hypothetical protein K492DRAFT_172258 [Lichtheimia hyalospora FSU 10163]|nr:hypothetical protein K492DRAFT_172258 [Lichtheimia hyalospora FSU 10163]